MVNAQGTSPETPETIAREGPRPGSPPLGASGPVPIEPDLDFIRTLKDQGGDFLKKCFQCGTCSGTCALSPDTDPFPRKEMAWAVWGLKDRLLEDPDVWLCYQCNDCSSICPRGSRPGDVLAAVRRECVLQYSFPRFLARWAGHAKFVPFLLLFPTALLCLALVLRVSLGDALGISEDSAGKIAFSYTRIFPQWLLNIFFGLVSFLVLVAIVVGTARFWRALRSGVPRHRLSPPARALFPSILTALKKVFTHEDFAQCTEARPRFLSHFCVFFGFLALGLVSIWAVTARHNPLIPHAFVYPFNFWYPWKMLANLGGAAVLFGCLLMIRDRLSEHKKGGVSSHFDWALVSTLLIVVLTGFAVELLHYFRLEPHRHVVYFIHLIFAMSFIMYLPYSKLAHIFYRTTAIVFTEYSGRAAPRTAAEVAGEADEPRPETPSGADS